MTILKEGLKPAICSDHAGYELKSIVVGYLESKGIECRDFGAYGSESCDYADFLRTRVRLRSKQGELSGHSDVRKR